MNITKECLTGGLAACGACLFTNPLEVVKTRMQLQGELMARGTYAKHYKNVFHAFYTIGKVDGIFGLQKGLVPGMLYQFFMNGMRLGSYQVITNLKLTSDRDGNLSFFRCIAAGAFSGCLGAFTATPFYMLKTQLQAQASASIAVGTQHNIKSVPSAFMNIYRHHGIFGLWRGSSASMMRVTIGSATQLSTYSTIKDFVISCDIFDQSSIVPFTASMFAGGFVALLMTPADVVTTRIFNQRVASDGKGAMYGNIFDVFRRIYKVEGFLGFYKGLGPHYFRIGPHTILNLVFWEKLKHILS